MGMAGGTEQRARQAAVAVGTVPAACNDWGMHAGPDVSQFRGLDEAPGAVGLVCRLGTDVAVGVREHMGGFEAAIGGGRNAQT